MSEDYDHDNEVPAGKPALSAVPGTGSPTTPAIALPDTKVIGRVRAFFGDLATKNCVVMTPEFWAKQGLSKKDANARPLATAVTYTNGHAKRALYEKRERIADGRKIRELDGEWLRFDFEGKPLPPASPLLPARARNSILDLTRPLHITDREDVTFALAASDAAVVGVAHGASLFANEDIVDSRTPDDPRRLHASCGVLPFEGRDVVFIFEDRDAAIRAARGLRQGGQHTGRVFYVETSLVLAEIDSGISQGLEKDQLYAHTLRAPEIGQTDITTTITTGQPGSIGARVPPAMLACLPPAVRDLTWPVPEGGGTSWENLDWALGKTGAILGVFRDQKGEELLLNKPALALRSPVYVTRRLTTVDPRNAYLEIQWAEPVAGGGYRAERRVIDAAEGLQGAKTLTKLGIPVAEGRRASQWFQSFLVANPELPEANLHLKAGWVMTEKGWHFLMPETKTATHEIADDILTGVCTEGDEELQWQLIHDLYHSLDPINQMLVTATHASLLISALEIPGCVFGLVDDTSRGKSVLLETALRQYGWGGGDYNIDASVPPTAAYLERVVQRANGLCVAIDEFHKIPNTQKDAQHKGGLCREEVAYFLSNGQRRGRSNASGGIDATTKRIYCYSIVAGEVKHITALDRAVQMEGARVRFVTLPLEDYSEEFLQKYGGLAGFMRLVHTTKGHIGKRVAAALADAINTKGKAAMAQEIAEIEARLIDIFKLAGATSPASLRRVTMYSPGIYMEMFLAKAFASRNIWCADFEGTSTVRALQGKHARSLMLLDGPAEEEKDDISISQTLREALHRDPTRIQGLKDEEHPNPRPLGRLMTSKRSDFQGIQLYPKAVFEHLKREGISEVTAKEMMMKNGDFALQHHKNGKPSLLHKSNGGQWIIPTAGWGWELLFSPVGDEVARSKDPYAEARDAFASLFEIGVRSGMSDTAALKQAFHEYGTKMRAIKAAPQGSLKERLGAKDARAWVALVRPLLDRLQDKPGADAGAEEWEEILQSAY